MTSGENSSQHSLIIKYRAANALGAKVMVKELFTMDIKGNVIRQERM